MPLVSIHELTQKNVPLFACHASVQTQLHLALQSKPSTKHKIGGEQEGKTDPRSGVYAEAEGLLKLSKQRLLSPVVLISFFILHTAGFHLMLMNPKSFVLSTSLPK